MERLETLMAFCGMRARKPYQLYWGLLLMAWNGYRALSPLLLAIDSDSGDKYIACTLACIFHTLIVTVGSVVHPC
jgi:hypothetical protein